MSILELLTWLDLDFTKEPIVEFDDLYIRYNGESLIDISESKKTFDRWSNSIDYTLDLHKRSEKIKFIELIEKLRT